MKKTPAFPFPYPGGDGEKVVYGMTMRQWYKGMAPSDEVEAIARTLMLSLGKARGKWADMMLAEDAEQDGEMSDLTLYDHDEQGESGHSYERQQIMGPQMITVETKGIEAACRAAFNQGLRVAVEAVENCSHTFMRQIDLDEAIAAIKAQEGK